MPSTHCVPHSICYHANNSSGPAVPSKAVTIRRDRIDIMQKPRKDRIHFCLLERNETRRVRRTDTGTTVLDRFAIEVVSQRSPACGVPSSEELSWQKGCNVLRDRELGQVVANHLGLDLNLVELLAGVDTNNAANHLGDDNHVSEVGLDEVGLLVGLSLLFGLAELLDQTHGLALQTTVDSSAGTGVDDITELVGGEVEKSVGGKYQVSLPSNHPSVASIWVRYSGMAFVGLRIFAKGWR